MLLEHSPCCHAPFYRLSEGMHKCSQCRRKYSPRKVQRDKEVIACFIGGRTAKQTSEAIGLSYPSIRARYEQLRLLAASYLERRYEQRATDVSEFEEYIYLEASKRHDKERIFDAHNFITFEYDDRVYNLLMPNLNRFKQAFVDDGLSDIYYEQFTRFLRIHRIAKLQKQKNRITEFWAFFETFITRYKGVSPENFAYYLKEAEFKFNYSKAEQEAILLDLWFAS